MRLLKIVATTLLMFSGSQLLQANAPATPYRWIDELEQLHRVDLLPSYRTDCLVEQISSYDPTYGNDDGFDGTHSYIRKEGDNLVIAELEGPGVINRIWTPTPNDDTLKFFFDGETAPRLSIRFSDLFSGKVYPFIKPVCGNEAGGFYCYLPIPYEKSCKVVLSGKEMLFHQFQYRRLTGHQVESYTGVFTPQERATLESVCETWRNISPTVALFSQGVSRDNQLQEKSFILQPGEEVSLYTTSRGGRIVGLEVDGGNSFEGLHKDVIISTQWDKESPSLTPVADFFGYAYGRGAMRSLLVGRRAMINYCYLPMPFERQANVKLIYLKRGSIQQHPIQITSRVWANNLPRNPKSEGKFYTCWRREQPQEGEYYTFADLKGKGHYVGTMHLAQGLKPEMTLFFEGDDSTYVDGKMRIHGTGSEDYFNGGWYALLDRWDRGVSLPLHGALDYSLTMARTGGYRFYLTDKMPYERELYLGIEHGPQKNSYPVDYTSVAYYYSANPPAQRATLPNEAQRTSYTQSSYSIHPQLMNLTLGRGLEAACRYNIMIKAQREGMIRVMLDEIPEGRYEVFFNYMNTPNGADFSVWQRQNQLLNWRPSKQAPAKGERISLGIITLTHQTNSLTVHVRPQGENNYFEFGQIYLVAQP